MRRDDNGTGYFGFPSRPRFSSLSPNFHFRQFFSLSMAKHNNENLKAKNNEFCTFFFFKKNCKYGMSMKEKRLIIRLFGCYSFINYDYLFLLIFFSPSIVTTRSSCRICRTKTISTSLGVEFVKPKKNSIFLKKGKTVILVEI